MRTRLRFRDRIRMRIRYRFRDRIRIMIMFRRFCRPLPSGLAGGVRAAPSLAVGDLGAFSPGLPALFAGLAVLDRKSVV